jgi:hypothetical protein
MEANSKASDELLQGYLLQNATEFMEIHENPKGYPTGLCKIDANSWRSIKILRGPLQHEHKLTEI